MKKKVLAILGSPRIKGNSDILLDYAIKGAKTENVKIKKIILNKLNFKGCQNCGGCNNTGKCVIKDDMQNIYSDIITCDRIIISSPIYFSGISSQTKMMIDRCQCLWIKKFILNQSFSKSNFEKKGHPPTPFKKGDKNHPPARQGLFLCVSGRDKSDIFKCVARTIKDWFFVIEVKYKDQLWIENIDKKDDILKNKHSLNLAYKKGKELVK